MARIALQELTKVFSEAGRPDVRALENLTLEIQSGEAVAVLGPSGCGKTTLLRLLAGLDTPTAGSIRFDDRDMRAVDPGDRNVSLVFQSLALYPHLTVAQNLGLGLRLRGTPTAEIHRRVRDAASLLRIGPLLDRLPGSLSGGERQRVAIGRALVRQPAVVLLDEPFASLDPPLRAELRAELRALHTRLGFTLVHVTHDQEEALTLASRVAVLEAGRLVQCADPATLVAQPASVFIARFVGQPAINLIEGVLQATPLGVRFQARPPDGMQQSELACTFPNLDLPDRTRPRTVILGVRPEHIQVLPLDAPAPHGISLEGRVEQTSRMGWATGATVRIGAHAMLGRTGFPAKFQRGTPCRLCINPATCLWFNPETGQAIQLPAITAPSPAP
jgi:ABC-type sugar transport system ATPase subunit